MTAQPVISFAGVAKDYPGVQALKGISFEVSPGRIHGFLGPNGAGKTTAMNILTGLTPPREGDVTVFGHSVIKDPFRARESIGFLPEHPPLYDSMRVEDYLTFVDDIHHLTEKSSSPSSEVERVIQSCGLNEVRSRLIGNLSKGYRQRVGIAQALVFDPQIIVMDEPTIGLDPAAIAEIRELIRELGKERTVLLSSHLLHEVENLCDDITIIHCGEIVQSGTLESVQKNFQSGTVFKVEIEDWSEKKKKKLEETFPCEKVVHLKQDPGAEVLEIYLNSTEREDGKNLSRFLVENDCGLLHFEREQLDLEEIFHLATGGKS